MKTDIPASFRSTKNGASQFGTGRSKNTFFTETGKEPLLYIMKPPSTVKKRPK